MNNYEKAKKTVNKYVNTCNCCYIPITGPTGPQGPVSINVGTTTTLNPGGNARVINSGTPDNVILDFEIPAGQNGICEKIIINSTTTGEAGTEATINDNMIDNTHYLDFTIPKGFDGIKGDMGPKGDVGPTGPEGPNRINACYLVTFEDKYPNEGLEIKENERLPITRKEIDSGNIINIDNNNIITFTKAGHYKVSFIVNGYIKNNGGFDEDKDFLSVGFRKINTDNIYIGNSLWFNEEIPKSIIAEGILAIVDTTGEYELANLSKQSIFLKTPKIENINTKSFFVNMPVSLIIEYLGR